MLQKYVLFEFHMHKLWELKLLLVDDPNPKQKWLDYKVVNISHNQYIVNVQDSRVVIDQNPNRIRAYALAAIKPNILDSQSLMQWEKVGTRETIR